MRWECVEGSAGSQCRNGGLLQVLSDLAMNITSPYSLKLLGITFIWHLLRRAKGITFILDSVF